jgi:hypothetical protein
MIAAGLGEMTGKVLCLFLMSVVFLIITMATPSNTVKELNLAVP